jgi:hypothetical protein
MSFFESFRSSVSSSGIYCVAIWWLMLCGLTAWLARGKGHNPTFFFVIAFFFSPALGLLALIAARDLHSDSEAQMARDDFRDMLGPMMLQIDGIRGHLAVSSQSATVQSRSEASAQSKMDSVMAPSEPVEKHAA